jgi:hypothetical protein
VGVALSDRFLGAFGAVTRCLMRDMWRREFRSGALAKAGAALPDFVPIMSDSHAAARTAVIEIEIGGAVLRADAGVDLAFLGKIIRLLKAT